jgi:hypothetical protein
MTILGNFAEHLALLWRQSTEQFDKFLKLRQLHCRFHHNLRETAGGGAPRDWLR